MMLLKLILISVVSLFQLQSNHSTTNLEQHLKRSDEPVVSQSDNTTGSNNPLNLKTADAKSFRKFDTVEEGLKASTDQLFRYFAGEGPAKGKPTKSVKDVIALWRPASDRQGEKDISQANYEKLVAKTIGVKPNETIDINNPQVLGKLLQGISKVEGNEIDLDTIMKSIGGVRRDGSYKGAGWLGPIERPDGYVMTELAAVDDGLEYPLIVPTLTKEELDYLKEITNDKPLPESIKKKALAHAKKRIAEGKSPFID